MQGLRNNSAFFWGPEKAGEKARPLAHCFVDNAC